jgi:pimeloyl-ACP methyl ester carboxylesterase
MRYLNDDGSTLYYEEAGAGEPVVFVHGNWTDHATWARTVDELPASVRAIVYDRRGTGRSTRTPAAITRRRHEDDLAMLIESLGAAPVHAVGNSYGGSTVLGLAARRPELFGSIAVHEPPLVAVVGDDPAARAAIARTNASMRSVLERIDACDPAGAAEQFTEEVAIGPGGWAMLPGLMREIMTLNAPTVGEEQQDPALGELDLEALGGLEVPVLLTKGDRSPEWFAPIVDRLDQAIEGARVVTIAGAGHNPHATHPAEYAAILAEHARAAEPVR